MRQGQRDRLEVRVARTEELRDAVTTGLRGRGVPVIEPVSTSPFMGVELFGKAFDITPLSPQEQLVAPLARWEFDVLPRKAGKQSVLLSVTLRVALPQRSDERMAVPVFERSIRVSIDPVYGTRRFVGDNWQWLAATALGLGGTLGAWIKLAG